VNRLRVATYNVHKCRGLDWRVSIGRVSKVLCELEADLIAVQETFRPQVECFARRLSFHHVFQTTRQLNGQDYGNAVLSLPAIVDSEPFDLTVEGREPRGCLRVALADPNVQFFAVHLGTSFFERRHQAMKLASEQVIERPEWQGRRIIAGDFNEWTNGLATRMLSRCLQSADISEHLNRRRTYPGVLPFLHLDHIYYDRPFHLNEMHLHRSAAALVASDHLPLLATFEHR
jgi:endonuclease/exonuclease/phosphatase family metal-dependent hydrolase